MRLGDVFAAVACKPLAAVEIDPGASNQHELNGARHLIDFFERSDLRTQPIQWLTLRDDQDIESEDGSFSFYDARASNPNRAAEWRLYYAGTPFWRAAVGDHIVMVRTRDERILGLIIASGSTWEREVELLLGISLDGDGTFRTLTESTLDLAGVGLRQLLLLDELGIDVDAAPIAPSDEELVAAEFGTGSDWPTTRAVIELAQRSAPVLEDADEQLVAWIAREEQLFRALERLRESERIRQGFVDDAGDVDFDAFIAVSLRIHNRRKSRMGRSLEGHLASLFERAGLRFDAQARTEGRRTPDFLFPGAAAYHAAEPGDPALAMLAAKSSCKERWRQILPEAAKIPIKHLCTLEPAISSQQLEEMRESRVVLVVPERDHAAFAQEDRRSLWTVGAFVGEMRAMQLAAP